MLNDPLSNTLSNMLNAEKVGKTVCITKPSSKVIKEVLKIMMEKGYIKGFQEIDDGKGKMIKVELVGRINKCGVIKPRFSVTKKNYEKFEKRYLPASGFGIIIVSTSKGIMPYEEAKKKGIGGRLISYVY
ncbi:MAG: 30S ribosomal protein S8 [Candidatus Nanoarchaeia archaeon]